jgi:hypothetical protein
MVSLQAREVWNEGRLAQRANPNSKCPAGQQICRSSAKTADCNESKESS